MEKKSNVLLKVAGILMIVGGAIAMVVGIIAVIAALAVAAIAGSEADTGLLTIAAILVLVSAIVEFIAGILGAANASKPEKAQTCIIFGVIVIICSLLGNVITIVAGGTFNVFSAILGLALPVLYLIGAFQSKSRA